MKKVMHMTKVHELFVLEYGHSLELNRLNKSTAETAVNFVGRAARNNGVTARVEPVYGETPASAGTISVALGGQGGAGVAFLQPLPYYCGRDVMVLSPINPMSEKELLWWATCITANRFRFGFGRQANRTLKDLELPSKADIPQWVQSVDFQKSFNRVLSELENQSVKDLQNLPLEIGSERTRVEDLFDVVLGTNLELLRLTPQEDGIAFVSRTARNNGISARVSLIPGISPSPARVLSVAGGGSVLETFVQFEPFYSGRDLFILNPKVEMCDEELMFYAACIRENRWRFNYGRQANRTLKELEVPAKSAIPKWVYGSFAMTATQLKSKISD